MSGPSGGRAGRLATILCLVGIGGIVLSFPTGRPLAGGLSLAVLGIMTVGIVLAVVRDGIVLRHLPWLVAFAALSAWSARESDFPGPSLARLANGLILMVAFPAGQIVGRSVTGRRGLAWICTATLGLAALDLASQRWFGRSLLLGVPLTGHPRISGSLPNPNDIGFVTILAPIAAGGLSIGPVRASVTVVWALASLAVFLSGSRNAILGLLAGAATGAAAIRPGSVVRIAAIGAAVALAAAALDLGGVRQRIVDTLEFAESARFEAYRIAWSESVAHPWLGSGPCVFFEIFARNQAIDPAFPPALRGIGMPWIHNLPLEVVAERGWPAGICLLVLLVLVSRRLLGAIRGSERGSPDRAWCAGVAGAMAAMAAMSVFDLTFLKDWFSTVFWLVIGLACSDGTSDRAATPGIRGSRGTPPGSRPPASPS